LFAKEFSASELKSNSYRKKVTYQIHFFLISPLFYNQFLYTSTLHFSTLCFKSITNKSETYLNMQKEFYKEKSTMFVSKWQILLIKTYFFLTGIKAKPQFWTKHILTVTTTLKLQQMHALSLKHNNFLYQNK
jgi:hypothetical protein